MIKDHVWLVRLLKLTISQGLGAHSTMDSVLALNPGSLGSIPAVPKNFSEFLMLPRLINALLLRAVDSRGLTTLIKPV